jgi:hypothetical protein
MASDAYESTPWSVPPRAYASSKKRHPPIASAIACRKEKKVLKRVKKCTMYETCLFDFGSCLANILALEF